MITPGSDYDIALFLLFTKRIAIELNLTVQFCWIICVLRCFPEVTVYCSKLGKYALSTIFFLLICYETNIVRFFYYCLQSIEDSARIFMSGLLTLMMFVDSSTI